jgi:hypothetical protein
LLLVDDASRFKLAVLLPMKAVAVDAIKHVQAAVENESSLKLQVLRTDHGGKFATSYADEGIWCHYSASYSPQQNNMVERQNQTIVATAYALLKQRGMLAEFWGEAVRIIVHLHNRSPTKSLEGKTPYEAMHGRTPAVGHLRTFGCLVYIMELKAVIKLCGRSMPGMFNSYAESVQAYRVLNPVTRRVHTTRDVIFDEGHGWDWSKETNASAMALSSEFTVDYTELERFGGAGDSPSTSGSPAPALRMPSPSLDSTPPAAPTTALEHGG